MNDVRDKLPSSLPTILALLVIAIGLIAPRLSLQSPRPAESDRLKAVAAPSVPSRLWQDPMAAVELAREESGTAPHEVIRPPSTAADRAGLGSILRDVTDALQRDVEGEPIDDSRLLVLPVMLSATPFRDDAEERRRVRYAVVSGLLAEGYAPSDAEHIKFVTWCPHGCAENCGENTPACEERERIRLPYELFEVDQRTDRGDEARQTVKAGAGRLVLVLWVGESDFDKRPLTSLQYLSRRISPGGCDSKSKMAVVGPATSHFYVRLIGALARNQSRSSVPAGCAADPTAFAKFRSRLRFYSYGATVPNEIAKLEAFGADGDGDPEPGSLLRVIGGDDELVRALVNELGLRHVNERAFLSGKREQDECKDEIVLLVEQDSMYGRNLGRELEDLVDTKCRGAAVLVFNYFRGVDGRLPTLSGKDTKEVSPALQPEPSRNQSDRRSEGESAAGRSQYDYLQRLVDRVVEIDDAGGTQQRVRAIGVFGSDVYDKLLILEAMRSRIHDAVYFTTDLDARFLHYDQRRWCRNLIVASHFGLELEPAYQQGVPAFRSVYQTAAYLGTRLAVGRDSEITRERMKEMRGAPHRFEIGRTRAVDLMARKHDACRKATADDCTSFHPPPVHELSRPSALHSVAIGIVGVLVVLLTTRANRRITSLHRPKIGRDRWEELLGWLVLATGALFVVGFVKRVREYIAIESGMGNGEPFVWLQGVSAWPSLVIQLVALVLALVLAAVGLVRLRRRAGRIADDLGLPPTPGTRATHPRRASDGPEWHPAEKRRLRTDWLRGPFVDLTRTERVEDGAAGEKRVSVERLWQRYLARTSGVGFWSWILLATALFGAFAYVLYRIDRPLFAHRGHAVALLNDSLWRANAAVLWATIFWIMFEARACAQLVNRLASTPSCWPAATLARWSRERGVPEVLLVDALDFELTVRAAERVDFIVYLPFVQMFLLGLACHPILGATDVPLPLVVVALVSLLYVVYAMYVLRRAAGRAKGATLEHYRAALLWLTGGQEKAESGGYSETHAAHERPQLTPLALDQLRCTRREAAPAQIRTLVEQIESTHDGPFRPLLQQPFLRAMLIPFGGWSGVAMIEPLLNYLGR